MLEFIIMRYVAQIILCQFLSQADSKRFTEAAQKVMSFLKHPSYLAASGTAEKNDMLKMIQDTQSRLHLIIIELFTKEFEENPVEGYDSIALFMNDLTEKAHFLSRSEALVQEYGGDVNILHTVWNRYVSAAEQNLFVTPENEVKTIKNMVSVEELNQFCKDNNIIVNSRTVGIA